MLLACLALVLVQDAPAPLLAGRVLAPDGSPATGRVYAFDLYTWPDADPFLGMDDVGPEGGFEIALARSRIERSGVKRLGLLTIAPDAFLSIHEFDGRRLPLGQDIEIQLRTGDREQLRILDPRGEPIAGARVSLARWKRPGGGFCYLQPAVQELVAKESGVLTNAEGIARGLPCGASTAYGVRIQAAGHGTQTVQQDHSDRGPLAGDVQLVPTSPCIVRWVGEGEPPVLDVEMGGFRARDPNARPGPNTRASAEGRIEPGATSFSGELLGSHFITLRSGDPRALELGMRPLEGAQLSTYEISPSPNSIRVRARVVEAGTQTPVPGLALRVFSYPFHVRMVTDANGELDFTKYPGPGSLESVELPAGFYLSDPRIPGWSILPDAGETEVNLGDLEVTRNSEPIEGRVVDGEGRAVAGAWVVAGFQVLGPRNNPQQSYLCTVTDTVGGFRFMGYPADTQILLEANYGRGTTLDPVEANGEPVVLTLSTLVRPQGQVLDGEGLPVAGARLEFWSRGPGDWIGGEKRVAFGAEQAVAGDGQGRFQGPPGLQPDQDYCATVRAPGCEDLVTGFYPAAELSAGIELRLRRTGTFAGHLLDPAGEALAGVPVRLRSGASNGVTDDEGRFRLDGVGRYGDTALAELPDGRVFATEAGVVEGAPWTLHESSSERPFAVETPMPRNQEVALAGELLQVHYDQALASGEENRILRSLQALAWVDPALALDAVQRGEVKGPWAGAVQGQVVDALRRESPDEALAVAELIDGYGSALHVMKVVDALPASSNAAKLEHLALARAKARQIQAPAQKVVIFSWVARRLLDLGEEAAARTLFDEGLAITADLPSDEWSGFARASFAEELAVLDLERALELIDELASAEDRPRHWGNIAHRLASRDPAASERILKKLPPPGRVWSIDRIVPRVVYAMAPLDLERALRIAGAHERSGFSEGMIASALADIDPARARRALDLAFERVVAAEGNWMYGPIKVGASLLEVVERVAPEDLERRLFQVLAIAPPQKFLGQLNGSHRALQTDGVLAFYAARWDRELARRLITPAVEAVSALTVSNLRRDWNPVWAALAVTDLEWAERVARELGGDAMKTIGQVLAVPPEQRRDYVQDNYMNLWIIGKEDI